MSRLLSCSLITLLLPLSAAAQAPEFAPPAPKAYIVHASEFVPTDNSVTMQSAGLGRYPSFAGFTSGSLVAPVHLPDGARVIGFELEYCRTAAAGAGHIAGTLQEYCARDVACYSDPQGVGILTDTTRVGCYRQIVGSVRPPADNVRKMYYADLTVTAKEGLSIVAFRVYYRSASPARPVSPTGGDVPVDELAPAGNGAEEPKS